MRITLFARSIALVSSTLALCSVLTVEAQQQPQQPYTIGVMPPGGPPPRLADGRVDFTGHWFPNGAGQGVSGRYGVDPAATRQFDPKVTPETPPAFQPWALAKIKAMTPTELELSKSSVNCMPRGVPAIWLQNPYTTYIVHKPGLLVQLYEVLNNWRLIHLDGRPLPKDPEPFFHGNSAARWDGDTLVVESIGFDERTYIQPNGWFHSDALRVTERYTPVSPYHLLYEATIEDPKVFTRPWTMRMPLYRRHEAGKRLLEYKCVEFVEELMYGHLGVIDPATGQPNR